jgi:plastocyanin
MKRLFAAAVFAAVLTVSACGSSGGGSGTTTNAAGGGAGGQHHGKATITIMDFGYAGDLTVKPGESVTVENKDAVDHTLTARTSGQFDTGSISADGTGSFVAPTQPGTYPFGCTLHPEMTGVLTVTG